MADRPGEEAVKHWMPKVIQNLIGAAKRELLIANAYVIPDQEMIDTLRALTARGVTVRILTNSLATTDVPAVNSHYKQWRRPLIEAGVELHEVRPDAALKATAADTAPISSSYMGLHAKAIVLDRERVFVGSMNLDPRSAEVNSEMGLVVESPGLGRIAADALDEAMKPENSWRVSSMPTGIALGRGVPRCSASSRPAASGSESWTSSTWSSRSSSTSVRGSSSPTFHPAWYSLPSARTGRRPIA